MKQHRFIGFWGFFSLALVLTLTWQVAAAADKPITLSWVSFTSPMSATAKTIQKGFFDRVNEMGKGELVIKFRGGPEAIAAFDQGKAVQRGIVDISVVPIGFYEALVPGVGGMMLSRVSLEEERRPGGGYDYLVEMHKKGGLYYLGRGVPTKENFFYLTLNKRVEKPEDFKGLKVGTATAGFAAAQAWGASVVSLRMPEYYSAMERGLVDGVATSALSSWVAQGVYEVTKYFVDHPYYQSTVGVIMNLDRWNKLPADLQKLLTEAMVQSEKYQLEEAEKEYAKMRKKIEASGVEFYKFAPEVAKWFLETAYDAAWAYQMKRFPEVTPKLKALLTKEE